MFIDSHAHIYSEQFFADKVEMLQKSKEARVATILMPAIDSETHERMFSFENETQVKCLSMMGLHPCSVKDDFRSELSIVDQYLKQRNFVAIGETGLDFYWDLTFKDQQYEAFEQQIGWALEYDIPIVIHSRSSTKECIDVVSTYIDKGLRGVFHCFGGSVEEAKTIMDFGFYLGIGGVLTFKKSGLDTVLKTVGIDKVVLETDAPYLAPTPHRGKRNEPAYIPLIAQKLADTLELPVSEIENITTINTKKLFRI
ncbi:MAG TPA: TatD family hydrolase [Niabella sp.]|nr:TatD family hydrolase [Niabella sp.]HQW15159.1 TatD family hydrolase [Niabella sp.]HQX20374.1 TatD family hydrolase [Niabella sp.]HQX41680.1 TatD family hydrolase [Niabella sp.]HRB42937.1 TatD family hydrolase [Niabella sp.]